MGVRSTLSQRPTARRTQTSLGRDRICLGLARLSLGAKFCGSINFKRREGHCCVPTFHKEGELKLGWWVATQRRNKKEMSADRKARLNKIGFVRSVGFFGTAPRLLTDQVRRAFAKVPATLRH